MTRNGNSSVTSTRMKELFRDVRIPISESEDHIHDLSHGAQRRWTDFYRAQRSIRRELFGNLGIHCGIADSEIVQRAILIRRSCVVCHLHDPVEKLLSRRLKFLRGNFLRARDGLYECITVERVNLVEEDNGTINPLHISGGAIGPRKPMTTSRSVGRGIGRSFYHQIEVARLGASADKSPNPGGSEPSTVAASGSGSRVLIKPPASPPGPSFLLCLLVRLPGRIPFPPPVGKRGSILPSAYTKLAVMLPHVSQAPAALAGADIGAAPVAANNTFSSPGCSDTRSSTSFGAMGPSFHCR